MRLLKGDCVVTRSDLGGRAAASRPAVLVCALPALTASMQRLGCPGLNRCSEPYKKTHTCMCFSTLRNGRKAVASI